MERATYFVRGRVQGVGFRWWTRAMALELGLVGFARNCSDGRVEVCAQGEREAVARLGELLAEEPSSRDRPGSAQHVATRWAEPVANIEGFVER